MNHLTHPLLAATLLAAGCAMPSYPDEQSFVRYDAVHRAKAKPEIDQLDQQLADGSITRSEYDTRLASIEASIAEKTNEALFRHHKLLGDPRSNPYGMVNVGGGRGGRGGGGIGGGGGGARR